MLSKLRFVICYWIASALFTASIAKESDRSAVSWFLLGLLFGPFALLAVGLYGMGSDEDSGLRRT